MMIPITKYHGLGNDFIITNYDYLKDNDIEDFVIKVCDRHTGIGADGAIFIKHDPLEMVYYNQDGSRAPMCGNGIRCFANYCYDQGIETSDIYPVTTLAGEKIIKRISSAPFIVEVNMGKAIYDPQAIDAKTDKAIWNYPLSIDAQTIDIFSFFMSTVHTVTFVDEAITKENEILGELICKHPLFAKQTNVNFVEVLDSTHLKVMTYERGCGITLACGTGVCASALCAYKEGKCEANVDVELKIGTLHIEIMEDETVMMSGPAKFIMAGEYEY